MMRLLDAIRRELMPRLAERRDGAMRATLNVGRIEGGHNTDAVPDLCTVEIDRRLLPSETIESALGELRSLVERSGEPDGTAALELLNGTVGFKGREDGAGLSALRHSIEAETGRPARLSNALGVSDGRYFARDGVEILSFGPGDGAAGHAANEWLDIEQLAASAAILWRATEALLGIGKP
jgi:acetylornithine deacetylase/succinyl-diaminopimelate desuccinylase-like protein